MNGGGNETDSHSHRPRSPTRTTLKDSVNQKGVKKDLPKPFLLMTNLKKILDNFLLL